MNAELCVGFSHQISLFANLTILRCELYYTMRKDYAFANVGRVAIVFEQT